MSLIGNRVKYLDYLKVALTVLVVFHHAGQPYGGSGGWWYFLHKGKGIMLGHFFAVNASFFMSLFFFLSAYFLPASFDKKGGKRFLIDRLKRLGIPLLFGFFILMPIMMYAYFTHFRGYAKISFGRYYLDYYLGFTPMPADWTGPSWPDLQFGHLWFIEHLLVYAILYYVIRSFLNGKNSAANPLPIKNIQIFIAAIFVSALTFFVRISFPIDRWIGFLGFIQAECAHVPQYATFFIAGIIAYRKNWIGSLNRNVGAPWLAVGLILAALNYLGLITFRAPGGYSMNAAGYAIYETFMCFGLCIGFVYLFKKIGNWQSDFLDTLSKSTYAVYIFHVPVLVFIQYSLASSNLSTTAKFLTAGFVGVVLTFALSHFVLRKLPYGKSIL